MRRVFRTLLIAALVAGVAASVTTAPSSGAPVRVHVTALDTQVLNSINAVRRQHGLRPLRLSAGLTAAASQHSREMVRVGYFQHESADGSAFDKRIVRFYPFKGYRSWTVGENLVWMSPSLDGRTAVTQWMHSPPHRSNLLSRAWSEVGISAVHVASAGGPYAGLSGVTVVTADFGARR